MQGKEILKTQEIRSVKMEKREYDRLLEIRDNYPKYVITADEFIITFVNQIWQGSYDVEKTQYALSQTINMTAYDKEVRILKRLAANKQMLFLMAATAIFSPTVIGIRYCLFKMGKLGDKKFKIIIQSIGFVLFTLYFRTLKDNVAYILLFVIVISYMIYQYYMLGLERKTK